MTWFKIVVTTVLSLLAFFFAIVAAYAFSQGEIIGGVLSIVCVVLIIVPAEYDPLIRLRERLEKRKSHGQ